MAAASAAAGGGMVSAASTADVKVPTLLPAGGTGSSGVVTSGPVASAVSWLLVMTGGGVPILSLTRGIRTGNSSDGKSSAVSDQTGAGATIDPFKFAHMGSVFTLHTTANNADFAVSHLISSTNGVADTTTTPSAAVKKLIASSGADSGSGSSSAGSVGDAAIGYRSYHNDNLLLIWSSAETDLLSIGSTDGGGSGPKIQRRIEAMYRALVMGVGLNVLLHPRADAVKKQLKSLIPVLSLYLTPPPSPRGGLMITVHTGLSELVLPSAIVCGSVWRALNTIRKRVTVPVQAGGLLPVNHAAVYHGHRLVCGTKEWSALDPRDLFALSIMIASLMEEHSSLPQTAQQTTGGVTDIPVFLTHSTLGLVTAAPTAPASGDQKAPPAAVAPAPAATEVIGKTAYRLITAPLTAGSNERLVLLCCGGSPLIKEIDAAIIESGLRQELGTSPQILNDWYRHVPFASIPNDSATSGVRGLLFVMNWNRIVFVSNAVVGGKDQPSQNGEIERMLTLFYHSCANALQPNPSQSSTHNQQKTAINGASAQITDSIMRTQNGTFVSAVRFRSSFVSAGAVAATATANASTAAIDTKSTPNTAAAILATTPTPTTAVPTPTTTISINNNSSAVFVLYSNSVPYQSLMSTTAKLHDKLEALVLSSA